MLRLSNDCHAGLTRDLNNSFHMKLRIHLQNTESLGSYLIYCYIYDIVQLMICLLEISFNMFFF